jgi:hypothetical protein
VLFARYLPKNLVVAVGGKLDIGTFKTRLIGGATMPKGQTPCQSCGKPIGPKSQTCKHCGAAQKKGSKKPKKTTATIDPLGLLFEDLGDVKAFVDACGGAVEAKKQLRALRKANLEQVQRCAGFAEERGSIDDAIVAVDRYEDIVKDCYSPGSNDAD